FFDQLPSFERGIVDDGVYLFKLWLNVGQAEQLRRMLEREKDPLKQWKLSSIDVQGLSKWNDYTAAIRETFERSHRAGAEWTIVRTDDKRRARIAAIRSVLYRLPYANKVEKIACAPDPDICGGPDIWHA
ncbi:MAG: polyphosphate kinase 2, partial [Pseudomonadota bacterium]